MTRLKDIRFAWFVILSAGGCLVVFLPLIPIDETRYVSVAWEMWTNHSFLVPLLNGQPYSHKPPMLFWLIQAGWYLFGVSKFIPRVVPLFAAMINLVLVCRIARELWPEEKKTAVHACIILSSTLIWTMWSGLVMFDMVLSVWVLAGLLGVLTGVRKRQWTSWMMIAAGTGGGILTKGPVALVHVLPAALFAFWWDTGRRKDAAWYVWVLTAVLCGTGIALAWAIPAAREGGKAYSEAIFWGQTAHRMVSSFAHHRPFWWYVPILPLIFFPWCLVSFSWKGLGSVSDRGKRFCMVWFVSAFIIFSVISGKQFHYLLPDMPAVILLFAKGLSSGREQPSSQRFLPVGIVYVLMGVTFLVMSLTGLRPDIGPMPFLPAVVLSLGTLAMGLYFALSRFRSVETGVRAVALSIVVFVCLVLFSGQALLKARYDLSDVSRIISREQVNGVAIGHFGKYYGQYQFAGRLKKPLIVVRSSHDVKRFLEAHPDGMIISYTRSKVPPGEKGICYEHAFRRKTVMLWKGRAFARYLHKL